ncbi:MAG: hypothetical protein GF370_04210 [Candidatus Nealsonbacteria bacterium]|nr:hypothetical protein [Candidatus Nealsonbacteria bacterium]
MFDVVTFGSATLDVFVFNPKISLLKKQGREGVFLPLGEKIENTEIVFMSGGGGANTAATFTSQGLKTSFCGMVGDDFAGQFVLEELRKFGIDDGLVFVSEENPTNCSVIFSRPEGKVILPYRGASEDLGVEQIPFQKLDTKWFYLAPLSGKLSRDFLKIIDYAHQNGIKVAMNPSKHQLKEKEIIKSLQSVEVLILNQEEASFLTKIPFQEEKDLFTKLDEWVEGICIMTKEEDGATVSDGKHLYEAPALREEVVDETGAGDSFGAGFVTEYMRSKDIESAIQFATANAAANLKEVGAKEGILKEGQPWDKVEVNKKPLS